MNSLIKISVLIMSVSFLSACVSSNAFSKFARQGDTITLAVGSPDGMTKGNTTVQFISDVDSSSYNLPIRALLKIRPDNTSYTATFNEPFIGNIEKSSSHSAWLSVLVIDLPNGMTVGSGKVYVTTAGSYGLGNGVNAEEINLEIIAGQGSAASFDYFNGLSAGSLISGDLSLLEPLPQVVVRPPLKENWLFLNTEISAVELEVNVPMQTLSGGTVSPDDIRIVQDDMFVSNAASQTQMFWANNGDGTFKVIFISVGGEMRFFQPRFSIVLDIGNEFITSPAPTLVSVTHYDINGDVIVAEVPTINDYTIGLE